MGNGSSIQTSKEIFVDILGKTQRVSTKSDYLVEYFYEI